MCGVCRKARSFKPMALWQHLKPGVRVRWQPAILAEHQFKGAAVVLHANRETATVILESEGNWRAAHNPRIMFNRHLAVCAEQFSIRGEKLRAIFKLPSTPAPTDAKET